MCPMTEGLSRTRVRNFKSSFKSIVLRKSDPYRKLSATSPLRRQCEKDQAGVDLRRDLQSLAFEEESTGPAET